MNPVVARRMLHAAPRGFTLIEMLIVIIIFAALTLATFPNIARITTHSRVNNAAQVVAQDLSQAITDAVRHRKPIRIVRGSDMQSIVVTDRQTGTVLSTRGLGPSDGYYLDSVSFSVTPVDIFPNGFTSSALTLTLWDESYSRRVTMSSAGWVRVP